MTFFKSKLLLHWPLLFVWLILIVFFYPVLIQGKVPLPADVLVGLYHPYRDFLAATNPSGVAYKNFLITDPVLQQYPWKQFAVSQLQSGKIPWWNPYTFSGTPLLANFQAGVFYPLNLIFFLFSFTTAWTIFIVIQPLLASLFLYAFLRHHRLSPLASALAALTWVFSGFFIVWLEWGNIGHTLLWLPLILLATDKIIDRQSPRPWLWPPVLIFALASQFFAGHLQIAFYVLLTAVAYTFWRLIKSQNKSKTMLVFAACYGLVAIITAIQWLPTLQLIELSGRDTDQTQTLTRPDWFLPWQNLVQLIAPDFFGHPATLNYFGVWNYSEFVGYIGLIPLILALSALSSTAGRRLGLVVFIILLFALPTPLAKLPFILNLPFIASAQPSRLLALITFGFSLMAGLGFEALLRRRWRIWPVLLIGAILLVLWPIALYTSPVSQRNLILPSTIFIIFISLLFLRSKIKFLPYLLVLLVAADLLRFATKFTPFSPTSYLYPQTQVIKFLQTNLGNYRFMTLDRRILPPNAAMVYGLATIEGYDPLYLKNYARTITQLESGAPDSIASFNRIIRPTNLASPLIDQLAVKYVLTLAAIDNPKFKPVFQEGNTFIYENIQAQPIWQWQFPYNADVSVVVSLPTQTEIKINNFKAQTLTLSLINYPGWKFMLDGQLIVPDWSSIGLPTFAITTGEHTLSWWYQPQPQLFIPKFLTPLFIFILLLLVHRQLLGNHWWLGQLLLLASPWFIQLLYSPVELSWLAHPVTSVSQFLHNLSIYSSDEFIFFTGDKRLSYGTQEFGLLFLSWLPLWLIGLIKSVSRPDTRWLSFWLLGSMLPASLFAQAPVFSAGLLYIPAAQILIGLGLVTLLRPFLRYPLALKLLVFILLLFMVYELIGFIHTLIVHYPIRLNAEGLDLHLL